MSKIGIKGIPRISEIIQIKRDLEILKYTGGKLFIPYITCKESVELIKNAKDEGLNINCSTPIMHLVFDDSETENFNENYKFIAHNFSGKYLDCGTMKGYIKSSLEISKL